MLKRLARWILRKELSDLEGRLRYSQFHKDAATSQRMATVKELRGIEARVFRGRSLASRMGHLKLRHRLQANRA